MSVPSAASTCNISQRRHKRIRMQTRPTPWKDSWELDAVGRSLLLAKSLLSSDGHMSPMLLDDASLAELTRALHAVSMWKARSEHSRIPHSMDTTFVLAQAAWRDAQSQSSTADAFAPSSVELRMSYATAILRGVNGLADALQQNRAYAASVATLCEQMGLPGWLVDVRHEAAHNDLPSLSVLRLAAKTFLGYLEERYWVPLANARWEAREAAVQLLVKYKAASKNNGLVVATDCKEEDVKEDDSSESSSEESEVDDSYGIWGQTLGTNHNRFAALFQASSSESTKGKKKRKKDTSKKEEKKMQTDAKKEVVSALHFARQFVRDVPIDIGHQVALSFLVWGGIGDAPAGRGVLIPGSAATFPASEEGAQKIRQRYKPLLFVLCKTWPGFTHALLVHLVDQVMCIEASSDEQLDAGSERKLYFLTSWIRFLLSKEFHLHHDSSIALCGKNELSKIAASSWTKDEHDFMESPASYSVLCRAGLPMNSLCDRFTNVSELCFRPYSRALAVVFNGILGVERVPNAGIHADVDLHAKGGTALSEATATRSRLSLAEVELMLSNDTNQDSAERKARTTAADGREVCNNVQIVWTKCQAWDACAIGSLPGHPV